MPNYDDGESFTAGDDTAIHFDNGRLVAILAVLAALIDEDELRDRLRLAILREIFGRAEDL